MKDAAQEIHNSKTKECDNIVETAVSCNGTWQRRGYASMYGCVAVISMENGKVLDVEPWSKVGKVCKNYEEDADATEH